MNNAFIFPQGRTGRALGSLTQPSQTDFKTTLIIARRIIFALKCIGQIIILRLSAPSNPTEYYASYS